MPGTLTYEVEFPPEKEGLTVTATLMESWMEGEEDSEAVINEVPAFGPIYHLIGEMRGTPYRAHIWQQKEDLDALREDLANWRKIRNTSGRVTVTQKGWAPDEYEDMWVSSAEIPDRVTVRTCRLVVNFIKGGRIA